MKKFNPEKELEKVKNKSIKGNNSKLSNMYVPLLVIACSCLAMSAVTFSAKLESETKNKYTIRIDIINGDQDVIIRNVSEGAFSTSLTSKNSFGSIECSDGTLNYDPVTSTISSPYVNQNISCVLAFMDDSVKEISTNGLEAINDNSGKAYYYKANATNNYVKINEQLYRIIRINGDGTYRIMLNEVVLSSKYGNTNDYMKSNLKSTLEAWFKENFNNEEYLVAKDYDVTNYVDYITDNLLNFEGYLESCVGTLSVREASLISEGVTESNFLNTTSGFYLMNGSGPDNAFIFKDGEIKTVNIGTTVAVRPTINIKGTLIGDGTVENPYTIKQA